MLQKLYVIVNEYLPQYQSRAVVIEVDTAEEFLAAEAIFKKHINRFRGIQLKSSLFQTVVPQGVANNYSVILESVTHMQDIVSKSKEKYVELIISYELFDNINNINNGVNNNGNNNGVISLLKQCERADRIIVYFENEEQLLGLNDISKEFVASKRFPLTQNVPLCKVDVKFTSEIYLRKVVVGAKPKECNGCIMQKYCPYEGKGFVPKPILNDITNNEKYKEVLSFLNNEDSTARF